MSTHEPLLALEEQGWRTLSGADGARFYAEVLTADALMLLPGAGLLARDAALAAIDAAPPWSWFRIEDARVLPLTEDSAIVIYRATAQREGQPEYTALISSTYVHRDGAWKLALHQQTVI